MVYAQHCVIIWPNIIDRYNYICFINLYSADLFQSALYPNWGSQLNAKLAYQYECGRNNYLYFFGLQFGTKQDRCTGGAYKMPNSQVTYLLQARHQKSITPKNKAVI